MFIYSVKRLECSCCAKTLGIMILNIKTLGKMIFNIKTLGIMIFNIKTLGIYDSQHTRQFAQMTLSLTTLPLS